MANCPKCGRHLRLVDWKQHCPDCGANIFVYNQQERLMQEADIAEVQYYHFQKKIDRLKAAFIGTKLAIVRIFTSLLPIAALFLPLIKATITEPFKPVDGGITAMTIYDNIDGLIGDAIPTLLGGSEKSAAMVFVAAIGLLVLSLLAMLLHFLFLTLACSPKGKTRNMIIDIIILATTVGAVIAAARIPDFSAVKGVSLGIGAAVYVLLQLVNVGVDFAVLKMGIPVNHKQCYVGGIPIEEYFEMQEKGMSTEEIRKIQYERLQAIQDEREAQVKAAQEALDAEEKKNKEAATNG